MDRGAWVETYESQPLGVEQQWHFAQRPAGRGALDVRISVDGTFASASTRGLRFTGGPGLMRYGHGTWVDASGRRTEVRATYHGGAVHLVVPADVVDGSDYPAVLDPVIEPESPTDEPVLGRLSARDAAIDGVATDGSMSLVVWREWGAGRTGLYAARVTAAGDVLDPTGIQLTDWDVGKGFVEWNGTEFVVLWKVGAIAAARVGVDGAVLESRLLVTPTRFELEGLGWNGAVYLLIGVMNRDNPSSAFSAAVRVTSDLTILDPLGIPLGMFSPRVASNGTDFLTVGGTSSGVIGKRITTAGTVLDPAGIPITTAYPYDLDVASDGQDYFVIEKDSDQDLVGFRVTANGVVLDASPISVSALQGEEQYPKVRWNGANWLVAWLLKSSPGDTDPVPPGLQATRVTSAGLVLDQPPIRIVDNTYNQTTPAARVDFDLQCGVTGCLLPYLSDTWGWYGVWTPGGAATVFGVRLGQTAGQIEGLPFQISFAANQELQPAVAWNGQHFLVAWADSRGNGGSDIYAARLQPSGVVIDATAIPVSVADGRQTRPRVASNGSDWLVTWEDWRNDAGSPVPYAVRVAADGGVLDLDGVSLSASSGRAPDIAAVGSDYLAAWTATDGGVRALRLSPAAQPIDATELSLASTGTGPVAVSSSGQEWAVAWSRVASGGRSEVRVGRVSASGVVRDPGGVRVGAGDSPSLGSDGTAFLVARRDANQVKGRLFPNGSSDFSFTTSPVDGGSVSISFDDHGWLLAWPSTALDQFVTRARRVSTSGVALDGPNGFPLGGPSSFVPTPALACAGSSCLLANARWDDVLHVPRAVTRPLTSNALPVVSQRTVTTAEDVPVLVAFAGFDADGDALSFRVIRPPSHGVLVDVPPNAVRYEPSPDFHGTDDFSFVANDQLADSAPAEVSITVTPVNDAPVPAALTLTTNEDTPAAVTLSATDVDGDSLTFRITRAPHQGTLSGMPPVVTYQPAEDFNGVDDFEWVASDGVTDSAVAAVTVTVRPVNDAPVASSQALETRQATTLAVQLEASDVEGDALTYDVVAPPGHGTLSGNAPNLRYLPASDFVGLDVFRFRAGDGQASSDTAEVRITVTAAPDAGVPGDPNVTAPAGGCGCSSGGDAISGLLALATLLLRRRS